MKNTSELSLAKSRSSINPRQHSRAALACFMLVLTLGAFSLTQTDKTSSAFADEAADAQQAVDSAQSTLTNAEADMTTIVADHDALAQESAAMQVRIDELTKQAMEAQRAVIAGRTALSKAAVYEYRSGSSMSLITLVLSSESVDEMLRNLAYLNFVTQYQADEIAAQKARLEQFEALTNTLNQQKDAQEKKLSELAKRRVEAENIATNAAAQLKNAQGDQATRLAALKQMADSLAASKEAQGDISAGWNTNTRLPDVEVQPNPTPNPTPTPDSPPEPTPPSTPEPTPPSVPDPGIGWSSGVASAYGGSSDPYTPNPGTTATGALCDDWSMGVAVPMAWPNYRSYFGRTVEISYGGRTVYATVNDCGYMGAGSRSLDLQPGVWKAFGFSSCNDWGIRTVNYRFL